jgi:LPS O-antigen subunit length determinant protein (WzzB/FepE family)
MNTDHALAVLGGLLGGVLTALVAHVLEHRLLNPRRPA